MIQKHMANPTTFLFFTASIAPPTITASTETIVIPTLTISSETIDDPLNANTTIATPVTEEHTTPEPGRTKVLIHIVRT